MTPCVIYAAKSTTDEHGSIRAQLERCREHAARQGWSVTGEYHDEAASAYKGSRGPGLRNAKTRAGALAAEQGEAVLLVFATDRLARGDGRTAAHLVEYVLEGMKAGYRIEGRQRRPTRRNGARACKPLRAARLCRLAGEVGAHARRQAAYG
jgi:DNA invertase Pin-like site-specific DNA recombinase